MFKLVVCYKHVIKFNNVDQRSRQAQWCVLRAPKYPDTQNLIGIFAISFNLPLSPVRACRYQVHSYRGIKYPNINTQKPQIQLHLKNITHLLSENN